MLKKILLFIIIFIFNLNYLCSEEYRIIAKVDNEIITNIDIVNQGKYLIIFNPSLKNLDKKELNKLSKKSLIKELVKKKEVNKLFKIDDNSTLGENLVEKTYIKQGYNNKKDYLFFLESQNLEYEFFKNKLINERLWNSLIFDKYQKKVKIDEIEIEKKIKFYFANQKKRYEVNLSEIVFESISDYDEIKSYIKDFGFNNAAIKYSISDTSSKGGLIGWVNTNNLNEKIKKSFNNLVIGEITRPLEIYGSNIILKLNSKREIQSKFDLKEEIKKQVNYEKNKQLDSFSLNYYKKLKQNSIINEY